MHRRTKYHRVGRLYKSIGMAWICHICNTLQISKYLKIGNFVNLQQIIYLTRPRSFIKSIVYARIRCSKKWPFLNLSFFLSFFFIIIKTALIAQFSLSINPLHFVARSAVARKFGFISTVT